MPWVWPYLLTVLSLVIFLLFILFLTWQQDVFVSTKTQTRCRMPISAMHHPAGAGRLVGGIDQGSAEAGRLSVFTWLAVVTGLGVHQRPPEAGSRPGPTITALWLESFQFSENIGRWVSISTLAGRGKGSKPRTNCMSNCFVKWESKGETRDIFVLYNNNPSF